MTVYYQCRTHALHWRLKGEPEINCPWGCFNDAPSCFSLRAEFEVCNLLPKGVMAIFGPQDDTVAEHMKTITDMVEIPFIDTR